MNLLTGLKTYIGIALAVIGGLAGQLDVEAATELPGWVDTVVMVIGGLLAAFGRFDKERRSPDPK